MHRLAFAKLPTVARVLRTKAVPAPAERGVAVGANARGDVVVRFDVERGTLVRNDDAAIPLAGAQDPATPGLVAVDDDGGRALVMCAGSMHGDPSLVLVDLVARTTQVVRSFEGPGWVCGGFAGKQVIACEQRLGDRPRFNVVVAGKTVWSVDAMCPPSVPVRVRDDVVALLSCGAVDPITGTGPAALIALDLVSGTTAVLTPAAGWRVRLDGDALVVEGGRETVRVLLA